MIGIWVGLSTKEFMIIIKNMEILTSNRYKNIQNIQINKNSQKTTIKKIPKNKKNNNTNKKSNK